MNTNAVLTIFQRRFDEIAAADDRFGNTPDVQKLADAREEIARQLRDAEGNFSLVQAEATNAEIVAVLKPIQDAAKARLAALPPPPPAFDARAKVLAELAIISEFISLVPADDSQEPVPPGRGNNMAKVGDHVLFTDHNGVGPQAAIVSDVIGDGLVNLAVFNAEGRAAALSGIPHSPRAGARGRWTRAR